MYKLRWLLALRLYLLELRRLYLVRILGMDLHPTCSVSLKAKLDFSFPEGVHIGAYSYIAFDAVIFAHDMTRGLRTHTYIGERCFIGARSIIMPGIRVGDGSIVGTGAVVTRDVPPGSIAVGNPAKIVRSGIQTTRGGCLKGMGYLAEDDGWLAEAERPAATAAAGIAASQAGEAGARSLPAALRQDADQGLASR
jgi:acetyltransferase-like isoleucine patch superfamily enzyme